MQPLDLLRMEADIMNEPRSLPGDPLAESTLAGYWLYGYDMPDDLGGGFVTGELLLRADGVLLRRQTLFFPTGDGRLSEGFGPWEEVTWWEGETDPERAARVLHYRGYDLHRRDPAELGTPSSGSTPRESPTDG
jgi:hypothetical protein